MIVCTSNHARLLLAEYDHRVVLPENQVAPAGVVDGRPEAGLAGAVVPRGTSGRDAKLKSANLIIVIV